MSDEDTVYQFEANDIYGNIVNFEQYRGKVLLIVNTASKLINKPKLVKLQKIYDEYRGKPFEVLAFPCNQFFWQEQKTNQAIQEKYYTKMSLSFKLFEKTDVNGSHSHPLFEWLKMRQKGILGHHIEDNFVKFVVEADGNTVHRFAALDKFSEVRKCIDRCLETAGSVHNNEIPMPLAPPPPPKIQQSIEINARNPEVNM